MQLRALIHFLVALWLISLTASANEGSGIPYPIPPKAKAPVSATQSCVEPLEVMRRMHGQFLKHHRTEAVHQGIRTPQHSLVECINCHVTPNAAGQYPNLEGNEHFCRSCHSYAAVTVDCFQCHASKPDEPSLKTNQAPVDMTGTTH
ncbi:MAG: hypothetical protein R3E08_08810 [Thiotrichaceae bacterium]